METRRQMSIESILVMFLMILFAVSTCIMIIQGSRSYSKIIDQKGAQEDVRVAFSYINMRIKQNDIAGQIQYLKDVVDSQDALAIYHGNAEIGYVTYVYYLNGILYECYTDTQTMPTQEMSTEISKLNGFEMLYDQESNTVVLTIPYQNGKNEIALQSFIHLRSGI